MLLIEEVLYLAVNWCFYHCCEICQCDTCPFFCSKPWYRLAGILAIIIRLKTLVVVRSDFALVSNFLCNRE